MTKITMMKDEMSEVRTSGDCLELLAFLIVYHLFISSLRVSQCTDDAEVFGKRIVYLDIF